MILHDWIKSHRNSSLRLQHCIYFLQCNWNWEWNNQFLHQGNFYKTKASHNIQNKTDVASWVLYGALLSLKCKRDLTKSGEWKNRSEVSGFSLV